MGAVGRRTNLRHGVVPMQPVPAPHSPITASGAFTCICFCSYSGRTLPILVVICMFFYINVTVMQWVIICIAIASVFPGDFVSLSFFFCGFLMRDHSLRKKKIHRRCIFVVKACKQRMSNRPVRNERIKLVYLCPTVLNLVQLSRNTGSSEAGGRKSNWNSRSNWIAKFALVTNPFLLQLVGYEIAHKYIEESFFPLLFCGTGNDSP